MRAPRTARRLLAELVAIPSVHPEADSGGTPPGERAIAIYVADFLRGIGASVETPDLLPGRPGVVAIFEPSGPAAETVALAPHLDTVGVQGMTVTPFKLTAARGRLHGRGACDTKGPMAALLIALMRWSRSGSGKRQSRTRWIFIATPGEEQGSLGAEALLVAGGFKPDFAVALEPTNFRVVSAAKGILRVWIDVPGKAAHGAKPHRGVNAVYAALPLLKALRDTLGPRLAGCVHPVLGRASLNLGILRGGTELNIVPAACRIGLDIRVHPGCPGSKALALVREACARHAPKAAVSVHRSGPPFVTDRHHAWARRLRAAGDGWATADWFCDANLFAAAGIPAVAFGPGRIEQAHTHDEFISQQDLDRGVDAFLHFLRTDNPGEA